MSDAGATFFLSVATISRRAGRGTYALLALISDTSLLDTWFCICNRVPVYDARRIMPGEGANQMRRRLMANQNEGCSVINHDEEHGHGGCFRGHHGENGHGEHGHGGCCGHHGHGGCHHAKDQIIS